MLKKRNLFILGVILAVLLGAVFVYAYVWSTDTDGGFNIFQWSVCTTRYFDDEGNLIRVATYDDFCEDDDKLREGYSDGGSSPCRWSGNYSCGAGSMNMLKCSGGACVPK